MITLLEVVVSVGVVGTLVTILSLCVCGGCKNSNQKSELVGTPGVVKIRFDEEVPSPSSTTPVSIKRASTQNSQRSLPEIPHPVGRHDSGDTASEIYATVNLDGANKVVATASTSHDHPYEHAYAKVQNENTINIIVEVAPDSRSEEVIEIDQREVVESGPESVVISASVAISGQLPSSQELPYITPPSPRPSRETQQHFSGDSTDSTKGYTSISVREPLSNIRAQSNKTHLQPHYATVSDDSDEMYAAIEEASVGEGSDTYAQIAPEPRRRDSTLRANPPDVVPESHVRRSAPPEIGGPSTSKATHSRQASVSSVSLSAGALGSPKPEKRQANSPLPPPPQTARPAPPPDAAKHMHQRISSTGDLFNNGKLRRSLNEKHQRNNSCVSSSDFYGCNYPVEKHRFSSGDLMRPLVAKELNFDIDKKENSQDNLYNSIDAYSDYSSADANISMNSEQRVTESPSKNIDEMYAKVMKKAKAKEEARRSNDFTNHDVEAHTSKFRGDDPGYETIDRKKSVNHGYETIEHKDRKQTNHDPGYETVKDVNKKSNAIYANNELLNKLNNLADSGPNSIISSDPGYEHIAKPPPSDSDPNYEVLQNQPPTPPYATIAPNYKIQPTYSTVNKRPGKYNDWNSNDATVEPNYESMPHEPLYTTGSESDPNYESVRPKDPNYESVNSHEPNYESLRPRDPKYESLRSKDPKYDSVRSKKDPNYESVKYFEIDKKDPPYEKVNYGPGASVERSDSTGGYEQINVPQDRNSNTSIIKPTDNVVSDYFQV